MAKYFENIRDLFTTWYDGLSDRERRLVTIFSTCVIIIIISSVLFLAISKISSKNSALVRNREQLTQIKNLEGEYIIAKAKHEQEMQRIRRNNISLFSYIQGITSRLGLSVPPMTEQKRPLGKSNAVEVSVKVNLTKLSIDKLTRLLEINRIARKRGAD